MCGGTGDGLRRPEVPLALKQQCPECRGAGQVLDLSAYEQGLAADMGTTLGVSVVVEHSRGTVENEDGEVFEVTKHDSVPIRTVEYRVDGDLVTRRVFEGVLALVQKRGG